MEEEINFDIMRYDLDEQGYILNVYFGCASGTCTGYTGTIPEGYDDLTDWSSNANIRAYKIVDGNLTYDANRDAELQAQYEIESEENEYATHQWVRNQASKESEIVIDEFSTNVNDNELVILENSGSYDIPEIKVSGYDVTGEVNVLVSNKNLLKNDAVTTTLNGLTFTINTDKSITINGTSTAATEFTLAGSPTNTEMLFLIKQNIDYIKSGLTDNVSLSLYSFDGTDRTLVNRGGNEVVNLSNSYIITQSVLTIASGLTFNNVTIYPQIEVGSEATEYIKHEESKTSGSLSNNSLTIDNVLDSYDPSSVVMNDRALDIEVTYFTGKETQKNKAKIEVLESSIEQTVATVDEMNEVLNGVKVKQNEQEIQIDVISTNIDEEGNILGVKTETGFTFDDAGLNISKGENEFNTLIDNTGTYYKDGDVVISQTTKDKTITKDLVLYGKYYYGVDEDLDVSNFTKDDAMFVAEKYVDNDGEEGFGHFYNGGEL